MVPEREIDSRPVVLIDCTVFNAALVCTRSCRRPTPITRNADSVIRLRQLTLNIRWPVFSCLMGDCRVPLWPLVVAGRPLPVVSVHRSATALSRSPVLGVS